MVKLCFEWPLCCSTLTFMWLLRQLLFLCDSLQRLFSAVGQFEKKNWMDVLFLVVLEHKNNNLSSHTCVAVISHIWWRMWIYILVLLLFPYLMTFLLMVDIVPVFSGCSLLYRSETANSFSISLVRCFEFIAERAVHNSWWWQVGWDKLETKLGGWPTDQRYCSVSWPVPCLAQPTLYRQHRY